MIKNFKDIHNSEADLWMFGKKPPGKKFPGKLSPRIMLPENCPLEKSLIDIKHLFAVVNNNLVNIKYWFTANKLSLNVEKQNTHSSTRQARKMTSLFPLRQREKSILGVLLDQHLTWKEHIKLTENKIAKKDRYII